MNTVKKISWEDLEWENVRNDFCRKIVSGEKLMIAQLRLSRGAKVAMHHHIHEQLTVVLDGSLKFWLENGDELVVSKGEVLVIPSNVGHAAEALEDTETFDIFSPPREDWLTGQDHYLRQKT